MFPPYHHSPFFYNSVLTIACQIKAIPEHSFPLSTFQFPFKVPCAISLASDYCRQFLFPVQSPSNAEPRVSLIYLPTLDTIYLRMDYQCNRNGMSCPAKELATVLIKQPSLSFAIKSHLFHCKIENPGRIKMMEIDNGARLAVMCNCNIIHPIPPLHSLPLNSR